MLKLLWWYLLERLVNIPAGYLMRVHSALMIKTVRALREAENNHEKSKEYTDNGEG